MAEARHFLGVDFGTSNSFFCIAPETGLGPNTIHLGGDPAVTTAILYDASSDPPAVKAIGRQAEEEWGMATPAERRTWRLSTHFKPDLAVSAQARADAEAFLATAARRMTEQALLPEGRPPDEFPVHFGVPATALEGHEAATAEVARAGGFGRPEIVKEPIGALVHHLAREDLSPRDARGGIVVVDFGGGTCDVAYTLRLEVRDAWGEPTLGGRLFDDLFYQWFIEQNPGAEATIREAEDEYYVHWIRGREIKERFSEAMAHDRAARFRYNLPPYGVLHDATWAAFLGRAGRYRPSEGLRQLLAGAGPSYGRLLEAGEIDLVGWFREVIGRGPAAGRVRVEDVRRVILTGGSSAWPFVRDTVAEVFQVGPERILQSANPRGAIGEGLAYRPVLKRRYQRAREALEAERPRQVDEIVEAVRRRTEAFLEAVVGELVDLFFEQHVRPVLERFREEGGSLADLREQLRPAGVEFEDSAEARLKDRMPDLTAALDAEIRDRLASWFASKGIRHWEPATVGPGEMGRVAAPLAQVGASELLIGMGGVLAVVLGTILANLCGGGGVALLAPLGLGGPAGLMIGAMLGALVAGLTIFAGREKIEAMPLPSPLRRTVLRDSKIAELKGRTHRKVLEAIRDQLADQAPELRRRVDDLVRTQEDELGVVDLM